MRFRSIGTSMPGHPVLWLFALAIFTLGCAYTAIDSVGVYTAAPDGTVVRRIHWGGLMIYGGLAAYLAFRTVRVLRVCIRMHARPFETQRVRATHCRNCGYDLRATPDRCPECGRHV